MRTGALISFPGTIGIWLPFIIGSIENRMRDGGATLLAVRKRFSMLGTLTQAVSAVLFVLAPRVRNSTLRAISAVPPHT